MTMKIGVVSQKGGVGKGTVCRLLACELAREGLDVKIADLDVGQASNMHWHRRRLENKGAPAIAVELFLTAEQAIRAAENHDVMVFDGAPHATRGTLQIAKASDFVILPTSTSVDDMEPTIMLAAELKKNKVPAERVGILLSRVGDSAVELQEARDYVNKSGFWLVPDAIYERTAYRRAGDLGNSPSETTFPSLNKKVKKIVSQIFKRIDQIGEK